MKLSEKDKWLDQVILETAPVQKPLPDFEKWKQNHPKAIEILKSRAEKSISVTGRRIEDFRIVSAIIKSRITKFAAVAVIVAILALSVTFLEKMVTCLCHRTDYPGQQYPPLPPLQILQRLRRRAKAGVV